MPPRQGSLQSLVVLSPTTVIVVGRCQDLILCCCLARSSKVSRWFEPPHPCRAPNALVPRSLTIVFNAIFSIVILGANVSVRTAACLVVVITGFIVGVGGEVHLSPLGVQWGLISSVAVSLNSIYTKKVSRCFGRLCYWGKWGWEQRGGSGGRTAVAVERLHMVCSSRLQGAVGVPRPSARYYSTCMQQPGLP